MATDNSEVRAGVTGALYVGAVGSTEPSTVVSAWAGAWTDLGLLTEDGPTMQPSMNTADFKGWQEFFPVRTVVTERGLEWKFKLIQKNGTNLKLACGGGTVTSLGGGLYSYDPPDPSFVDYRAFGLEVNDGGIIDRYVLRRGLVAAIGAVPFKKAEPVTFDLTVRASAAPGATTQPWKLVASNDAAMAS
jgi:hypothetical protein